MTDMDKIPAERIVATGDGWLVERDGRDLNAYLISRDDTWGEMIAYAWLSGGEWSIVLRRTKFVGRNAVAYLAAMSALRDAVQAKAVAA